MRASTMLLAVASLTISESLAASVPNYLGRRVAMVNEALYGAKKPSASASVAVASATSVPSATVAASVPSSTPSTKSSVVSTTSLDLGKLTSIGFKALGTNSNSNNGRCWIGSDGSNVNTVKNGAADPIYVVLWGMTSYADSFMSSGVAPLITYGLAPGASFQISCADGMSGGLAAVYPDTVLSQYGQIKQTWVEFTWGAFGTVDISKEITMSGRPASVVGPTCTTDMNTCVFECKSGDTCADAGTYVLKNCGASNGGQSDAAAMNGGCLMGAGAKVTTTFS